MASSFGKLKVGEYRSGKGITRLIIGEMHNREGDTTWRVLKVLDPYPEKGATVVVPTVDLERRVRISTLSPRYTKTKAYRVYTHLLEEYRPAIVVELHSFSSGAYPKLVDPLRFEKIGVPPLVPYKFGLPIRDQVLHGGPPPFSKKNFKVHGSYITLEIHEEFSEAARNTLLRVLELVVASNSPLEVRRKLMKLYPESMRKAEMLLLRYLQA